jgi:hypothetical protein
LRLRLYQLETLKEGGLCLGACHFQGRGWPRAQRELRFRHAAQSLSEAGGNKAEITFNYVIVNVAGESKLEAPSVI